VTEPNEPIFETGDASQPTKPMRPEALSRDPLHGITLELMVKRLAARYGWAEMGDQIPIRCFLFESSVQSSLKFLRRTPWARKRVEDWYAYDARRFSFDAYDDLPPAE
jgi:uncharacterized protein (DUF2132 family)